MKININLLVWTIFILSGWNVLAQPTINYPTNGQVLYTDEKIWIDWTPRLGGWTFVSIRIIDEKTGAVAMIGFNPKNTSDSTGSCLWSVSKFGTNTNFTITLRDGSDNANVSKIHIVIPNGLKPVPIKIRSMVSVEWVADTNHTYRVQSSTNLNAWTTEIETKSPKTNASVQFYSDKSAQYFRVNDLTP